MGDRLRGDDARRGPVRSKPGPSARGGSRCPFARLDATAQAELVARGAVSEEELLSAACERIERVDPELGAVPIRLFESALGRGQSRRGGPFRGVPFLMKDLGARQRGQPYYAGNRALRDADHRASADTPLGARFRELGLVTVGKSSTPELGLQSITWPLVYGPTHNPWDPSRSAGGSSGGACAAVAAGLVPVAHASDGAGSIRIPAAWCGLVGLKPSRDQIVWRHAGKGRVDVEFVVARSLRDTAAFFEALRGAPSRRGAGARGAERTLRIGLCADSPAGTPVAESCRHTLHEAARRLADLGHTVEEAAPPSLLDYEERALYGAVLGPAEYRACLEGLAERLGRPVGPADVEPFLWELAQIGGEASPADLERAGRFQAEWVARTLTWFDAYDVLLTPTVGQPAPPLDALDPERLTPLELLTEMAPHMAFTEPWNATGQPALTLPLGRSPEGLPIGVQLVGGPERDELLLSIASQLVAPEPDPDAPLPALHA